MQVQGIYEQCQIMEFRLIQEINVKYGLSRERSHYQNGWI